VPTELTKALEGMGGALGGLANMAGDKPSVSVNSAAVEREAVAAAQAAADEADKVNDAVREAEAQVSPSADGRKRPTTMS
ncbi:SPFH/Band 7/PHB domain protein, partial [Actinoplanes sp. TRM 88003]|nr:SPFH/Band 7/PHB domain protein [Actinoplanes aksuensis]